MSFQNKTAVVAGAASGMGLLFSQQFSALGGNVMMADIHMDRLAAVAAEIGRPSQTEAMECDVRDYTQVKAVCDRAVERFGRIDICICFAGGTAARVFDVAPELDFPDIPIEVFDWGLDVNLKGPFYFAHAVMKQMEKQNSGLIVNIGSMAGVEGGTRGMEYATAKSGIMFGLTKSLAQYGARCGVRCVCVSPGPVLTRDAMANVRTMLGRAARPEEVIDLILFIASDKGQFIDGENIMIDGGRTAMGRDV